MGIGRCNLVKKDEDDVVRLMHMEASRTPLRPSVTWSAIARRSSRRSMGRDLANQFLESKTPTTPNHGFIT
eukprot:1157419-Pelagomonas_calceolata.AAC.3